MSALGQVRIGHKAPYFRCEAVISGVVEEVNLNTYIHPSDKDSTPDPDAPWLILLFIPAAFSFVCPTEVLAFQNCLEEFKDRNCSVVFVSVDTKHSLWHWQNVPRQYGGLGQIDIPLLSDANHHLSRDYGVLIEEEGVSLRGMFILDGEGIVQQITLNNLTVGRSVLEALRLLEAFQAVAKHGVLCPVDWKPNNNTSDTISTISNTLTESYDDRLANLQKEFGDIKVTDLDAQHGSVSTPSSRKSSNQSAGIEPVRSNSSPQPPVIQEVSCERPLKPSPASSYKAHLPSPSVLTPSDSLHSAKSGSLPPSADTTPVRTPSISAPQPPPPEKPPLAGASRRSQGRSFHLNMDHHYVNDLFSSSSSNASSIFQTLIRHISSPTDSSSGNSIASPPPPNQGPKTPSSIPPRLAKPNTYETRRGNHIVLEFADPTSSPIVSPNAISAPPSVGLSPPVMRHPSFSRAKAPPLGRATSWAGSSASNAWGRKSSDPTKDTAAIGSSSQTRLQSTFETIKKMSAGLSSPRLDFSPRKSDTGKKPLVTGSEGSRTPGYFDVVVEGVEA